MATSAAPDLQPWVRRTDSTLADLGSKLANLKADLARVPAPDRPVFYTTTLGVSKSPGSAPLIAYPADGSVVHINTTGLVEVTITPKIRVYQNATAGVGVFVQGSGPEIVNQMPLYGVGGTANSEASGVFAFVAASNVSVFSVPVGMVKYSIFFYTDTTKHANAQCAIDSATIIVRSL